MSLPAHTVHVAVQTPAHSAVGDLLSYTCEQPLEPGTLVRVPLGRRELLGVVWDAPAQPPAVPEGVELRAICAVLEGIAPLPAAWRRLVAFAAYYYQRSVGEIAVTALPPQLRDMTAEQLARRLRPTKAAAKSGQGCKGGTGATGAWRCACISARTGPGRRRHSPSSSAPSRPTSSRRSPPTPAPSCSTAARAAARPRST